MHAVHNGSTHTLFLSGFFSFSIRVQFQKWSISLTFIQSISSLAIEKVSYYDKVFSK